MGTVRDKLALLLGTKGSIREAISAMGQSVSDSNTFASYAAKIRAISSDATAAAGDILSGKTAYAGGKKITGSIASKGSGDLTASGATVSVPAGYYPSAVSKSVATATQATPGISVDANGLITASATQGAGYVAAGTKSATKQLTTQAAATITPGTTAKTAVAAGRYTTGAVQVAGDANLVAENIKSGVNVCGVMGTADIANPASVTIVNNSSYAMEINGVLLNGDPLEVSLPSGQTYSYKMIRRSIVVILAPYNSSVGHINVSTYGTRPIVSNASNAAIHRLNDSTPRITINS